MMSVSAWADDATTAPKTISRAEVKTALDGIFQQDEFRNARWGVLVCEANSTVPLYDMDSNKSFVPASNMKLYTTAAATDILGADWCWKTEFCTFGKVKDGVLHGDLVWVGSGDPTFSGRMMKDTQTTAILRGVAAELKKAGVRCITGNVIIDDSYLGKEDFPESWPWGDMAEWYSTESGAVAVNDNCWDATVVPGKTVGSKVAIKRVFPTTNYATFVNDVTTTIAKKDGGKNTLRYLRGQDNNIVHFFGEVPIDTEEYKEYGSLRFGEKLAATEFRAALRAEGIRVAGRALVLADLPKKKRAALCSANNRKVLYTRVSPPLRTVISFINKPSQNYYADMLCRTLARTQGFDGSWETCEPTLVKWLHDKVGVDTYGFAMRDGSGLSRRNMVTPHLTVELLRYLNNVAAPANRKAFYDSLPIAGVDGSIAGRMKDTAAAGNCHAKTGYIGHMRTLSGYVDDKSGHRWIFSMMINNYVTETSSANDAQDKAVEYLANLEGEIEE